MGDKTQTTHKSTWVGWRLDSDGMWRKLPAESTFAGAIGPAELKVVWAAMYAMVKDIHSPQDQLTEDEWIVAGKVFEALDREINR